MAEESFVWEFVIKIIIGGIVAGVLSTLLSDMIKRLYSRKKGNDKISISRPPHFQGKLIGRRGDIRRLNKKMNKNKCVWISAPGGYGKSTIAIIYARKYRWKYQSVYWLSWKDNMEATLTDKVNIVPSNEIKNDEIYNSVMYFFREKVSKNSLLIIDGLDNYVLSEIQTLQTFNCKILVTSRIKSMNHVEFPLDLLSDVECYRLFMEHSHLRPDKEQFKTVIEMTDKHTLTIKLLARYAYTYSMEKLFQDILNKDIKDTSNVIEIDDGEPNSKIITYLTRIYKITYSDNKKAVLMNLALLPANDIKISVLEEFIDKKIGQDLAELQKMGWLISRIKGTVYLHPVLSSTIRQISIDEDVQPNVYQNMIKNITDLTMISQDDFDDLGNFIQYIPYCESIVKLYRWENMILARLLDNISCIKYIVDADKELAQYYAEKAYNILEREYTKNADDENVARLLAQLLNDMSEFYYKDMCDKAIDMEKRAIKIKEKLHNNELELLKSYSNLMLYHHIASHSDYLEVAEKILSDYSDVIIKYKRVKANIYNHYALLLQLNGQYLNSARYFDKAREVLVQNNAKNHYMYPMIINSLGAAYGYLFMKYDIKNAEGKKTAKKEALNYMYESYKIKRKKFNQPNSSMAITLHNIATVWSEANHNILAMFYEYKALSIRKKYSEEEIYLASSYLRLGIIFTRICTSNRIFLTRFFRNRGCTYLEEAQKIYYKHKEDSDDKNSYDNELEQCSNYISKLEKI